MRAIRYATEEALGSLWRGRQAGLLSTATIALALFVLGAFLLVTANLDRLAGEWSRAAELSVYLKDDVTADERRAIQGVLVPPLVAESVYVSQAEAVARFKRTFRDLSSAVDGLGNNPLPSSFDVRLAPGSDSRIEALATELRGMAGVADVRFDRQWLDRLLSAVRLIRGLGLVIGLVLTVAAALTVANVVRLAFHARRDEIDIMELVGAPEVYIRGPFVMEGLLQGGFGALGALLALAVVFFAVRGRFLVPLAEAISLPSVSFLPLELCLALVVGGMTVGCVGGLLAAWSRP